MAESSWKAGRPASDTDATSRTTAPMVRTPGGESGKSQIRHSLGGRAVAERYSVGDLIIDAGAGQVERAGQPVFLPTLSFDLLLALARRAPAVVRRQELLSTVWPDEFVNDDTLSQRVRLLRKELGDVGAESRYLASLRGVGYRIVAAVDRLENQAPPIRSLAVLPLANISRDTAREYFADGMTEMLISALARIGALKIISRTSVMRYKHAGRPLPEIARELSVDVIVEGTVFVDDRRVRVNVQLIRAATDEHLWTDMYDREIEDVFALHAELAKSIAHKIHAVITSGERERLERHHRVDPIACELELQARCFSARFTPGDIDRSITYYEQAIARDPALARGYAGLAMVCFARGAPLCGDLSVIAQRALLSKGQAAAKQALRLDDTLVEAHAALGMTLLFHDWDWNGAERALEEALECDSNSSMAHLARATLASTVLDVNRTLAELARAIELDPLNLMLRAEAAECCFWIREFQQAIGYARQALKLQPSFARAHFVLGRVSEAQGRIAEAIAEYEHAGVIAGGAETALRTFEEHGVAGYHRWALRAGITAAPHAADALGDRPFFRARTCARLGEIDAAIEALEEAYRQGECLLVLVKAQEWWDPLRADPRFADLLSRIGIP